MEEENYPGVLDRIKAVLTDSVVLVALLFGVTYLFEYIEDVPDGARMIAFIFIFILYDPILTSLFGGTIGHMAMGIRVKKENNQLKNIPFPLAIIRFIVKALLGSISLLTVSGNKKGKAIHDYLVGSLVIYKR